MDNVVGPKQTIVHFPGKEVIQVLLEFGAVVERASVDEAYIDLTAYGNNLTLYFTHRRCFLCTKL